MVGAKWARGGERRLTVSGVRGKTGYWPRAHDVSARWRASWLFYRVALVDGETGARTIRCLLQEDAGGVFVVISTREGQHVPHNVVGAI